MANRWPLGFNIALLTPPLALLSERRFGRLPAIPVMDRNFTLPSLSIVIPARNEAENLRRLLPTLQAIRYPGPLSIIVVDDGSTDETSAVATTFNAQLIRIDDLPHGWLGKPHACHQGALAAIGEWLLFTDADTIHVQGGLAQAVAYAEENRLDGLSIFPRQVTGGVIDTIALMVSFAGLFAGMSKSRSFLNGQYILIRRETYNASRGFAAVAGEPLEDLALGHHLQRQGYRLPMVRGEDIVRVRMYTEPKGMWNGLSRIAAGSLRWSGSGSMMIGIFITGAAMPSYLLLMTRANRQQLHLAIGTWLYMAMGFLPWARRFGSGWWSLLAPVGAVLVHVVALWGLVARLSGRGVSWKGRRV